MLYRKYRHFVVITGLVLSLSACGGAATQDTGAKVSPSVPSRSSDVISVNVVASVVSSASVQTSSSPSNITSFRASSNSSQTSSDQAVIEVPSEATQVVVQGTVTYDRVNFAPQIFKGLDYDNTQIKPARRLVVELLNDQQSVIANTTTNEQGQYQFEVTANQSVQIRVMAELISPKAAQYSVQVRDNTQNKIKYALLGSLTSVGQNSVQTRDLHAASGWTGAAYSQTRSAAPFAILDSIYDAIDLVINADEDAVLPPLSVYWSPNNVAISGELDDGHIGTSFYTGDGPSIYLLGKVDNDSDEYDRAVIQHEFGHFIEHSLGRTESMGGSHSQTSHLDLRITFGEAWGNAFSAMAGQDPLYRDSMSVKQAYGFTINLENRPTSGSMGSYSEASVQSFLYDLFDAEQDATDQAQLGFKPIYQALTSEAYLSFSGFASIYSFSAELVDQFPELTAPITSMLKSYKINGFGWYGENETNDAGIAQSLPLYETSHLNNTVNVCSDKTFQEYNGFGVRRYISIELPQSRNYSLSITRKGGSLINTNPQLRLFSQGQEKASLMSGTANSETGSRYLKAGIYTLEVYEEGNVDSDSDTGGYACFDVRVI